METEGHWVKKPFGVGDDVQALCGRAFTVAQRDPDLPVCTTCAEAYGRLAWVTCYTVTPTASPSPAEWRFPIAA